MVMGGFLWIVISLAASSSSSSSSSRPTTNNHNHNDKHNKGLRVNRALRATHSRRQVNALIAEGRMVVNDVVVTSPDDRLWEGDTVTLDGYPVSWEEHALDPHRYMKFHKPVGVVCTTDRRVPGNILHALEEQEQQPPAQQPTTDDNNNRNKSNISSSSTPRRVFPIGRLDAESTGLILLTSNGAIVNPLLRSSDHKSKHYHVTTHPRATNENIVDLAKGVVITTLARRNGIPGVPVTARTLPCRVERVVGATPPLRPNKEAEDDTSSSTKNNDNTVAPNTNNNDNDDKNNNDNEENDEQLQFVLQEGRNRQIRKMCAALGLEVTALHRVTFAGVTLNGCERPGDWATLTEAELIAIGAGPTRNERRSPEERAQRKLKKLANKLKKKNRSML